MGKDTWKAATRPTDASCTGDPNWNFILDDDYFIGMSSFFKNAAEDAETKLNLALEQLEKITADGIVEGAAADSLKMFYARAKQLRSLINDFGKLAAAYCEEFISSVDKADRSLYF